MGIKNAEFDADFEPVVKFGKKLLRKKFSLKNGFFQNFITKNFLTLFLKDSKSVPNSAFLVHKLLFWKFFVLSNFHTIFFA